MQQLPPISRTPCPNVNSGAAPPPPPMRSLHALRLTALTCCDRAQDARTHPAGQDGTDGRCEANAAIYVQGPTPLKLCPASTHVLTQVARHQHLGFDPPAGTSTAMVPTTCAALVAEAELHWQLHWYDDELVEGVSNCWSVEEACSASTRSAPSAAAGGVEAAQI